MGEGRLAVRCCRRLGSGLCSPWPPGDGPHHRGLHGGVCPQKSVVLVEETRRLGGCFCSVAEDEAGFISDVCVKQPVAALTV